MGMSCRTAVTALSLAVCPLLASQAAAQQSPLPAEPILCDPRTSPYDAVVAAPHQHTVLFEDDHVRVLEIFLAPRTVEPVHIHALPSVIEGDSGGGEGAKFAYITYRYEGGRFIETSRKEVTPTPGYRAIWSPPEGPHAIANIGPVAVVFTRIEIKPEACARK